MTADSDKPQRHFKGVWIPAEIWDDDRLSWMEKCLLAEINVLDNGDGCTASNHYLAEKFGSSTASMANIISKLRDFGLLETVGFNGRKRTMQVKAGLTCRLRQHQPVGEGSINPEVKAETPSNIRESTVENKEDNGANAFAFILTEPSQKKDPEQIYQAYPRKVGKLKALKAIGKALKMVPFDELLRATEQYAKAWKGETDKGWCPHPATWFNDGRYFDDPSNWVQRTPNRRDVIESLENQISTHPANYEFKRYDPNHTEAQEHELNELKRKLHEARNGTCYAA